MILKEQIEAGEYRLRKALDRLDILYVDISGNERLCRMLQNINTMEEYRCLYYFGGNGNEIHVVKAEERK